MSSLASFPQEIIFEILSNLPLRTIELVALTLNHPVTEICISLLQPLFKARRTAKRLTKRFGPVIEKPFMSDKPSVKLKKLQSKENREALGLSPRDVLEWPSKGWTPDLGYLDLCGDLEWLKPLQPDLAQSMSSYWHGPAAHLTQYADLITSAERVGVTLPPAFLKFMKSPERQKRIPSSNAAFFCLGERGLHRVPKSLDGGAGGYLIRILSDQQACYFIHLYLEPGEHGGHCVLYSGHDYHWLWRDASDISRETMTDAERQEAQGLGVMIAEQPADPSSVRVVGLDFEEWLARMYYEESLWFLLNTDDDSKCPTDGLKEYVKANFVSSTLDHTPGVLSDDSEPLGYESSDEDE